MEYKMFNKFKSSKILRTAISSVGILLVISTIFSLVVYFREQSNFINPINILLGMNVGTIRISSKSIMSLSFSSIKLGILALVLCPIISIIISNLIFMRKYNYSTKEVVINSLGVGIVYGLSLYLLAILINSIINSYNLLQYGYIAGYSYRLWSLFVNGFIIGTLSTFLVIGKKVDNIYLNILKTALKSIGLGYILVLLILTVLNGLNNSYLHELGVYKYVDSISIVGVILQLAAYIWAFGNCIPVLIGDKTISIFNILGSSLFLDTKLIFLSVIALSSLIILVIGNKLKSNHSEYTIKSVLVFSSFYALSMGILSTFTKVSLGGSTPISMGFGLISSVVISFIYSFIVALVGYKLSGNNF